MPTITVRGCDFQIQERGQGLPLVLLHGFPLDSRMWDAQVEGLSESFRVIAPDLRGFGQSRSDSPFSMVSLAEDVQEILRQMDALPCALAGLSMGGYVALAYQQMCPTDLRALILMDTKADADTTDGKAARQRTIDLARRSGVKAVADQMLPKVLSPKSLSARPQVIARLRQMMESVPVPTIEHAQLAMCDREDRTAFLPSISNPVLVVVGQDDMLSPVSAAEGMQRTIPRAKLAIIPDAGHLAPMEQPEKVNAAVREFLDACTLR